MKAIRSTDADRELSQRRTTRISAIARRPGLAAGVVFLEAAGEGTLSRSELGVWFKTWVVAPGLMPMPPIVCEQDAGYVSLGTGISGAWAVGVDARLERIVAVARGRVSQTMAGLCAARCDDRFVTAAIFNGRVARVAGASGPVWRAAPRPTDRLSDIVLGLLTADVLSHREDYDTCLCVCAICGRLELQARPLTRDRCEEHRGIPAARPPQAITARTAELRRAQLETLTS